MPLGRRKGKQQSLAPPPPPPSDDTANDTAHLNAERHHHHHHHHADTSPQNNHDLVLTSEKRRGVYECDYCHSDISQLPRIRCAVCPDFDLCLDCFATTDHSAAIARLKAAASAHDALVEEQQGGTKGSSSSILGMSSAAASGVSTAAIHHDDSHGYRVCDSTRYPLFPTLSSTSSTSRSSSNRVGSSSIASSSKANCSVTEDKISDSGDGVKAKETTGDIKATDTMEVEPTEKAKEDEVSEQKQEKKGDDGPPNVITKSVEEPAMEANKPAASANSDDGTTTASDAAFVFSNEDSKYVWTVEEDLRLIDGIRTHGLGNWVDISEAVSGHGSTAKTPRRCMERYFDDFLGRYGQILPSVTLVMEDDEVDNNVENPDEQDLSKTEDGEAVRASKRRAVVMRSPSAVSNMSMASRKKFKAVPTESVPGYDRIWPRPYLPPIDGVQIGQEVKRDQAYKAEQFFVKQISQLEKEEEVEKARKEWAETRLLKPGGPTVLPMRPEDVTTLTGADLAGFMPRRGDFDIEWDNDAEQVVADMEFIPGEPAQDRELKLKVLAIYNSKLDEREKRKQFVLNRGLYDYRTLQAQEQKLPRDERDLVHRMRLFERFHTPEEHKQFIADLLKAKRLRKEIAKLQMYRRMGIRTLAEAEKYELDKSRRQFHKTAQMNKEAEAAKAAEDANSTSAAESSIKSTDETVSSSLWKQYRTSDRKIRKSINRNSSTASTAAAAAAAESIEAESGRESDSKAAEDIEVQNAAQSGNDPMEIDSPKDSQPSVVNEKASALEMPGGNSDDMSKMPGYNLLSPKEADLCRKLDLLPFQYQEIKKALIHESLVGGLLDRETPASSKRMLMKIDVQRRGDIVDFMVRAGWISSKIGNLARELQATASDAGGCD